MKHSNKITFQAAKSSYPHLRDVCLFSKKVSCLSDVCNFSHLVHLFASVAGTILHLFQEHSEPSPK